MKVVHMTISSLLKPYNSFVWRKFKSLVDTFMVLFRHFGSPFIQRTEKCSVNVSLCIFGTT